MKKKIIPAKSFCLMSLTLWTLIFSLVIVALSCKDKSVGSCMENPGSNELFVFVGKKIHVTEQQHEGMDAKFLAKYEILEKVCGNYLQDTIEFIVYDHYGTPSFSPYENVMLFVSKYKDSFYHEKYQYFNVYKTKNGNWASPSSWTDSDKDLPPYPLEFATAISFDVNNLKKQRIAEIYPAPYYKIENKKAIPIAGHYINDLLQLKKRGVLHYRGLFGYKEEVEVAETQLSEIENTKDPEISSSQKKLLLNSWKEFLAALASQQSFTLKSMSFDSVICSVCEGFAEPDFYNDKEPIDSFISAAYRNFPGSKPWKVISSGIYSTGMEIRKDSTGEYCGTEQENKLIVYYVVFEDSMLINETAYTLRHVFEFIKIGDKLKFYGMKTI